HRLSLHSRKVIFPEIRSIEQHLKGLCFIRFQTKIENRSIVSDNHIISFVFDKTTQICKSSIDYLESGLYNVSKRHILDLLIRRIAAGDFTHQLGSLSNLDYILILSVSTLI